MHYSGLLAPATKTRRLTLTRRLLTMPPANPQAGEGAQAFMRRVATIEIDCCPHCNLGQWHAIQVLAAISPTACRGPP